MQSKDALFSPVLSCVSTLPSETGNPEIAYIHLNIACGFANKQIKRIKTSPVTAEPPFADKTIDWTLYST